jgi:RNA polymerase sigma-70 factor (ECF subfamily)
LAEDPIILNDAELLAHFKKRNDSKYLGILLQRYSMMVFGVCMKYLKDSTLAEDSSQSIFEKVIKEIGKYEIPYFKSWLYSVAKNHCLMQLRKSPSKFNYTNDDISTLEIQAEENDELEINEFIKEEKFSILKNALQLINDEQKECITLFYLNKKSYKEIERITGFSFHEIKSHIQNGKRNLRIIIKRLENEK